jgi:large subunit ribosomal protein L4
MNNNKLTIFNKDGSNTGGTIELPGDIFGIVPNDHAIYMDIKSILANKRQGTHKSKERSEVKGSTKKLGRQKGGGGARHGGITSPLMIGGGRVFGPRPRDYSFKLNEKVKRLACLSALSYKALNNDIIVFSDFDFEMPKTKLYIDLLGKMNITSKKNIFLCSNAKNLILSARNVPRNLVKRAEFVNTYDIINADKLLFTEGGINRLIERFK